jgi:kinesin family protein 18/19
MLCEDPEKGACVSGLTEMHLSSADEVFELLDIGNSRRKQSPTEANQNSSRSHAVLQIMIQSKDRTADVKTSLKLGKLSLIDLAGSERASVSQNRGERLMEGANINKSLLALGNCINSLGENYKKGKYPKEYRKRG